MKLNDFIKNSKISYDRQNVLPRKIVCRVAIPVNENAEKAVICQLEGINSLLRLSTNKNDLKITQNKITETGKYLRFQQYIDGIPVMGGEVLVHIDNSGYLRSIHSNHQLREAVISGIKDQKITADDVDKIIRKVIGENFTIRPNGKLTKEKVYFVSVDGLILAWQVIVNTLNPAHDWHINIDAKTGDVLLKEDLIFTINGNGMVFNPNPVVSLNDNTIRDGVTAEATLNAVRQNVVLPDITGPVDGNYTLTGPYCNIINLANPNIGIPQESSANSFKYVRTDDDFEAVNVYFHIEALQRYIQETLGITDANNRTTNADPHDNSSTAAWYSPGTKDLHFSDSGPGVPDRAEDSDCMAHEYNHAIQDNMVPGFGNPGGIPNIESRSIGEGSSDILAVLYNIMHGNGYQRQVVEDWVFANNDLGDGLRGLRRVDHDKLYSAFSMGASYYSNSEIWSGALWNIFLAMGGDSPTLADWEEPRNILLKAMIASNRKLTTSPSMPDAAEALMETHEELEDQCGRHLISMIDEFNDREILECQIGSDLRLTELWAQKDNSSIKSYEYVEFGQDNWFYATITNSGAVAARSLIVNFSFKCPFSTPVYPADFRNNIISAVPEFDLLPGETRTIWGRWPKEFIPAIPAGQTSLHGCILAEIYNPVDKVSAGVTYIGASNGKLKQCNTTIVDILPNEKADFYFNISNFHIQHEELLRLEIIRPKGWPDLPIYFSHHNVEVIKELFENAQKINLKPIREYEELLINKPSVIRFRESAQIEVSNSAGGEECILNLAPDSSILLRNSNTSTELATPKAKFIANNASLVNMKKETVLMLEPGYRVGFPYNVKPRQRRTIKVTIKAPANARSGDEFRVEFIQRNVKGEFVGGFDVLIRIVEKKAPIKEREIEATTAQSTIKVSEIERTMEQSAKKTSKKA